MIKILLTQDKFALVDDEDFELISQYKWYAHRKTKRNYYAETTIKQKHILMHRLIMNAQDSEEVDHINGDGLNNQRHNLRLCTRQQNAFNRKSNKNKKFKGIVWRSKRNKWEAYITIDGKYKFLGHFKIEIKAAKAYDIAAKKHFGEFARLNFT